MYGDWGGQEGKINDPHQVHDGSSSMSTHVRALCWIVQAHV